MSDKSYLEQHHELLETLMSQCIHELLKSKPASPVAFISSFFARQAAAAPLLTTQTADEMALPTNQARVDFFRQACAPFRRGHAFIGHPRCGGGTRSASRNNPARPP
jgi:hypothetical protein